MAWIRPALFVLNVLCSITVYAQQPFEPKDASIEQITAAIASRQTSCETVVRQHLTRIKRFNLESGRGAPLNAFVSLSPSLFADAKKLDAHFIRHKALVGPLHCVPIVVKDNINTNNMPATSGTLALLGSTPEKDSALVKKLREAGAIILGTTTMDELASGIIGISSRSGRTGNAFDPTQNPGGSSGGSAVAVAAGFAVVGIGTDNSGSVRIPAAFNGLYGLRPSSGLINTQGVMPRGLIDGVPGPITRSVEDMAIVLSVMAEPENHYAKLSAKLDLSKMRFGIVQRIGDYLPFSNIPEMTQVLYQQFFEQLEVLGGEVVQVQLEGFDNSRDDNMAGEVEAVNAYLASFPSTRDSFEEICTSYKTTAFGGVASCLKHVRQTPPIRSEPYQRARQRIAKNRNYIEEFMNQEGIDALILPISQVGSATYDSALITSWQAPLASNAGIPGLSIPIGFIGTSPSMPVGIELVARQYAESTLLHVAHIVAKHTPAMLTPDFSGADDAYDLSLLKIEELNTLFTLIGEQTFNEHLQNHPPETLSAPKFNTIMNKAWIKQSYDMRLDDSPLLNLPDTE